MNARKRKEYWRDFAHRLRVTRAALGISEQQAADGFGVTLRTYRKYEAGAPQRGSVGTLAFAGTYDVCINWLMMGETTSRSPAKGKVVILPAGGPRHRRAMAKRQSIPA